MKQTAINLGGDILVKAAAIVHIHHLNAPADTQNRKISLISQLQHCVFSLIPFRAQFHRIIEYGFTEQRRVDVISSGENQAVESGNQIVKFIRLCHHRQQNRDAAEMTDGMKIALIQKMLSSPFMGTEGTGQTDDRLAVKHDASPFQDGISSSSAQLKSRSIIRSINSG